jgi:pre-mRNA cleavage complex 2 protein Pcf11
MAIDSILKNAKGQYIPIVEEDAKLWMPLVYDKLAPGKPRDTLERVWKIWRDVGIFSESSWKQMGSCFLTNSGLARFQADSNAAGLVPSVGPLRRHMQQILDDVQSEVTNELEKVSLERLAEINPDLLQDIKQQAESMMNTSHQSKGSLSFTRTPLEAALPSFFVETRTQFTIDRAKEWTEEWKKSTLKSIKIQELIQGLETLIRSISASGAVYSQHEAIQMTSSLAAAGVAATSLEAAMSSLEEQEAASVKESTSTVGKALVFSSGADPKLFTTEGVKKKDMSAIANLYEVGLPFTSSADGRRFKTQGELSNHLDYLFKKNQLEKSMERTEERGWFVSESLWTGEMSEADLLANTTAAAVSSGLDSIGTVNPYDVDPETFTAPADETQDRCAICDLNFKMFFDNDEGMYKYKNATEMVVLLDDAAEKESEQMLVHVTCWRALGSPDFLTMDQVLERHLNR